MYTYIYAKSPPQSTLFCHFSSITATKSGTIQKGPRKWTDLAGISSFPGSILSQHFWKGIISGLEVHFQAPKPGPTDLFVLV